MWFSRSAIISGLDQQVQRWKLREGWVISRYPAHPALVSEADFAAAQDATAPRGRRVLPASAAP